MECGRLRVARHRRGACACEVSSACRWGSDAVFQSLGEDRTAEQSRGEERRKGWEKMLRQAQQTSPSTRKKVKQSGDKCRSEMLILVELIPKFRHFERCFGSFSVFRKSCDAHMMLVFGFIYQTRLHAFCQLCYIHDYIIGSLGILM